jgi:EmrB/QacA subfamily drug resistance transporter
MLAGMHPRATLAATILASSLAFIDASVVNVALPALALSLHIGASNLPWVINAYLLPVGALTLLGGALGDHMGRLRLFHFGLSIFTLASIACAAAPSLGWLLAARGLQGLGAAVLLPNSLAIVSGAFTGEARGRAIGTWAAVGALAAALGPIAGGWIVDTVGWRTIFLINLPIAAAAGYLSWNYVEELKESIRAVPLDTAGAALATAALGLLTWSLTDASESSGGHVGAWVAALAGCVLLAVFLWLEGKLQDRAIMPLSMFGAPTFVGLNLLTFFLYGCLGGLFVLLPFFLIRIGSWPAVAAGASLLPVPVLIGFGSRLMGQVSARHGERLPLIAGASLVAIGFALYARVGAGAIEYWRDILPPTMLIAIGMTACVAPLTTSIMTSVDATRVGLASGFNSAVARIAGLIATALLGFVFARQGSAQSFLIGFRSAALIGAASAALAAASAAFLIDSKTERSRRI